MATIGKIYTKADADILFGKVIVSVKFSTKDLLDLLNKTTDYIMLRIMNSQPEILDNKRNPIYPASLKISSTDVFTVFSTSIVKDLIAQGNEDVTYLENRQDVFTATNGTYSIEQGQNCPPICP